MSGQHCREPSPLSPEIVGRQPLSVKNHRANLMLNFWLVGLSLALGIANGLAGPNSWTGESFIIAREVPGSTYTWAISLIVFSLIFTVGAVQENRSMKAGVEKRHWLFIIGALLCAFWNAFLAWCQIQQYLIDPDQISWNGPVVWSALGILWVLKMATNI